MSWITYSSRSSRHGERRYEKDKRPGARRALSRCLSGFLNKTRLASIALVLPLVMLAGQPAQAFPNVGINLKEAIEQQQEAHKQLQRKEAFRMGILGSFEFQTDTHKYQSDWQGVLTRIKAETVVYQRCATSRNECSENVLRWRKTLQTLKDKPVAVQLASLNKFVNRMAKYEKDSRIFGKPDHWASPLEFFKGRADCEDYAAVKFWSLLELGFSNDQLRLAVVRDTRRRVLHAVVTVDTDEGTMVLDSLFDHPVEQRHILKYKPVYSANLDKQWLHIVTRQIRTAYLDRVEKGDWKRPVPVKSKSEPALVTLAKATAVSGIATQNPVVDWT